ncbi:hypothetical protein VHEMI04468 [[Torrubiella] hemipterigena]|uniref:Amino acid transporter transmembrane domain-containing protein n=1 Tax=[Torrubiella] hemipterigena TaxID=1531966 RepID=A0A0A1TDW6_9HYPO|nr:hypothetical protein VHEMI04468 [[Torrubiella] hemipterigena]
MSRPTPTSKSWDGQPTRRDSPHGPESRLVGEEQALLDDDDGSDHSIGEPRPRRFDRRRSSVSNRLAAMADIGGPNSFRSFTRSWQRAAAFAEVIPRQPSFVYTQGPDGSANAEADDIQYGRNQIERMPTQSSLLSQHLGSPPSAISYQGSTAGPSQHIEANQQPTEDFRARESKLLDAEMASGAITTSLSSRSSIFASPPHLSSPSIIGSYGSYHSQYGTMGSSTSRRRPSIRRIEPDEDVEGPALGEEHPILVKEVKQGDRVVLTVEGQSTLPQSVFNAINAIIGVGMLSLPLAFKMSGWIIGLTIMTVMAGVTAHTGKLIGKCMEYDKSLITYSDLAYVSFGPRARVIVSTLFTLELVAACVALVILFADSLALLLPSLGSVNTWKCVCAALILILNALPLRWLSYTSVIGIFSTFGIVCVIAADGLLKSESPGSLWEPAATYLLPSNWLSLPLAYGLMASPWGAHSVFPSIYRDMRHPYKWNKAVKVTFSFSYVLDTCLAVIGILMFGDDIKETITSNIIKTSGYPETLTVFMCICVAIIPLTKIPLSARPLITTADVLCGLHYERPQTSDTRRWIDAIHRGIIRISVVMVLLFISIAFPAFDSVCAFLGAALCTLISILLPVAFYLKLHWEDISKIEKALSWAILASFSVFGIVGTIWTFLPKDLVGA